MVSVYPREIEDQVYLCGFTSPKSYGAMSYFIRHPDGNWLIDSPRWEPHLERKFKDMGGIRRIFLTHRDDVGDAGLYAKKFKADRVIHEDDKMAVPDAEILVYGQNDTDVPPDMKIIPVPGHTKGHTVLLYKNKFLFTGDHLEWDVTAHQLEAYRDFCWYNWAEQTRSMEKLLNYAFEWVLPGHGGRQKLPVGQMQQELARLVQRMKS